MDPRASQVIAVPVAEAAPLTVIAVGEPKRRREKGRLSFWKKLGGGSLAVSIVVHAALLLAAAIWVIRIIPPPAEKTVDFMPAGGGGGNPSIQNKQEQKQQMRTSKLNAARVAAIGAPSVLTLPEDFDSNASMANLGSLSSGGGGLGGSGMGGGRGTGQGAGYGSGSGLGAGGSMNVKPIVMFGTEMEARKIAVVMDVSGSMTPYLTRVVQELDRVAAGSPVMLARGCSLTSPREGQRQEISGKPTGGNSKRTREEFEAYWRLSQTNQNYVPVKNEEPPPIPSEQVYKVITGRLQTFYMTGPAPVSAALMSREMRNADAIYWFSDFQDEVTVEEMERVLKHLKRREQKLYMHASTRGRYFNDVRDKLVIPSGGKVIEVKITPKKEPAAAKASEKGKAGEKETPAPEKAGAKP